MMTPARKGNVPESTPAVDQPMPLSTLETATARPKLPVSAAVETSSTRRDIIDASRRASGRGAILVDTAPVRSLDQPALLGRHLLQMLEVLLDELVERIAGKECVDLRGFLDVVLPLRRRLNLLHEILIERDLIGADLAGQPYRARLLVLGDCEALLDAGRNVAPAFGRGDLRSLRQSLRAEGAERTLRAAAPLSEAFAGIVDMGADVPARQLHRGLGAALEGNVGEFHLRGLLDQA